MSLTLSHQIILDEIPIQIQRKKNIKRLSVKIHPYKGVLLNVPFHVTEIMINEFLESVKPWIKRQFKPILPLKYQQGEKHLYLGVEYPLNIISSNETAHVVLSHDKINIYSLKDDGHHIYELLCRFYQIQASTLFPIRVHQCMQRTPWVKRMPQLKYRFMSSRYGSCSSQGNISLNLHLIKTRLELIDYVILHELCHIKEHHHGPNFYQLMNEVVPNWMQLKEELREFKF